MNAARAKEILQAEETYPVHLNGEPIWIEHVDEQNGTARVQFSANPDNAEVVPVEQLVEPGKVH